MTAERIAVVSAVRTPIGRYMGGFSTLPAPELGVWAAKGVLESAQVDPADVGVAYFGQGRQAGSKPNPARQVTWGAGLPQECTATTVNIACASGMKSLQLAADDLRLGRASVAMAGGMESMTRVPFMLDRMREGYRLGHAKVIDGMYHDGFQCPLSGMIMGETAELLAQEMGISREEQDVFALRSQQKAADAWEAGRFADELVPVTVSSRKGDVVIEKDEHLRPDTTLEKLAKLPAVFAKEKGTVTPGNASGITDGAASLLLMTETEVKRRGLQPLAYFLDSQVSGTDPKRMGLGPVPATQQLFARNGWSVNDFGLFEVNEAFAAQVLACQLQMPFPEELVNVNGGSIALGHPIGCTGARIVVTLLHEMKRRGVKRGLATLCVSGGLGMTSAWELAD